jgi:hypothetical protein
MCETDQIALVRSQPAARHNVYDDGIIEVAGKYVVPLKNNATEGN